MDIFCSFCRCFAGMHGNQRTNRPEEREELTHSAWESVVCVGAGGGTDLNCYNVAKLSIIT